MIGVLVCLDYTCLLDNAEKNIRSKFYSIIAILAALDGILMNTSVAVFQSHGDDNHPSAHQLPCNSTDLNRLHKTTTIGKRETYGILIEALVLVSEERCGVNFGDFFQSDVSISDKEKNR